jgi:SAM-dependent methyltransferase
MSLTAGDEQRFYDDTYRRLLDSPDEALRWDADRLRAALDDPVHPFWERRRLFGRALEVLLAEGLAGRRALDYGCGTGDWGVLMAGEGAEVTLLDLSPVAVEVGLRRARASGVADRVRGLARDAADLGCFADGEFQLVLANASLHHTMKYPGALAELERVIAPDGVLVLVETYGNNPALGLARRLRARLAREPAEQGEGIVLSDDDIDLLRAHFATVEVEPLNLLAMAKRLLRGRYDRGWVQRVIGGLEWVDGVLLGAVPGLRRMCGEVVVVARR